MKNRIKSTILFYIAFGMISVIRMMKASMLFNISNEFYHGVLIVSAIILFFKYLLDEHSFKETALTSVCLCLLAIAAIHGLPLYVMIAFVAFVSMKSINIHTVLKTDLIIKCLFFFSHLLIYELNNILDPSIAINALSEHAKGIANSLYFVNPNTTGLIGLWISIDYMILAKDKKVKKTIIATLFVLAIYALTLSRTSLFIWVLFIILSIAKENTFLNIISKVLYPLLFALSLIAVSKLAFGNELYDHVNTVLSGRLSYSISVYNIMGFNIFPANTPDWLLEEYIIDNFYVRCITCYGVITALLYYLPHLLLKKKNNSQGKIMSILLAFYLFSESVAADIGLCPAYLIISNEILNGSKNGNQKK